MTFYCNTDMLFYHCLCLHSLPLGFQSLTLFEYRASKNIAMKIRMSNDVHGISFSAQKIKFPIKDYFSKCDQNRSFLQIWSHLLKKSFMKNFIYCALKVLTVTWVSTMQKIIFKTIFLNIYLRCLCRSTSYAV